MPTCSIVIPAFNEEKRLGRTLSDIANAVQAGVFAHVKLHEVIVSDDGSTDRTVVIAHEHEAMLPISVVSLPENQGKGAAVRAGMLAATGDYLLMYDADGATPIGEIGKLFAAMSDGADIAIGSRVTGEAQGLKSMKPHRRFIGRVYRFLTSPLIPGINDAACGCKLFRSSTARKLFMLQKIHRFAFDIEILALALRNRLKVMEIPVLWTAVPESKVRLFKDGPEMFFSLFSLYFPRRDASERTPTSQGTAK